MSDTAKVKNLPQTQTPPQTTTVIKKVPTLDELVQYSESTIKQNQLMVLLNQPPPEKWIKKHPTVDSKYLPINRIEYLLSAIFTKWWVEVMSSTLMANSIAVTIRLFVVNPLTGETEWQDGVGAAPIQTGAGKGATDWDNVKSAGVQMALPIAKSYAIKDAAELFGKLFGKDLNRKEEIAYTSLLQTQIDLEDLKNLFELKREHLTPDEITNAERIIKNQEKNSYNKLYKNLSGK